MIKTALEQILLRKVFPELRSDRPGGHGQHEQNEQYRGSSVSHDRSDHNIRRGGPQISQKKNEAQ
jgi:hypothetical protein